MCGGNGTCAHVLCFPVFHTYIFEYNSTKGEQKRKLQNNILRKTSQDGKLQRERDVEIFTLTVYLEWMNE